MVRKKMVVLDSEEAYAELFASFAAQKRLLPFEPMAFTSIEKLETYAGKISIGLLLVSEHMLEDRIFHIPVEKLAVLNEKSGKSMPEGVFCVDKYQPCTKILETLLWEYERNGMYTGIVQKRKFEIAAVCSPIGRTGKTAFALALSRFLSKEGRVLYLNLEGFSGFDTLLPTGAAADVSDLFYLLCQGREQVFSILPELVQEADGFDYIAPAPVPEDLEQLEENMWVRLFDELERMSRYEKVVLDLGRSIKEMEMLLPYCQRIFVPIQRDGISAAKLTQFKSALCRKGQEKLLEIIQEIEVPRAPFRTPGGGWEGRICPQVEAYAGRVWRNERL